MKDVAHRRPRVQPRRPDALGHPPSERHLPRSCASRRRTREWTRVHSFAVRHGRLRPRRLARRHARVGLVRRDQRQAERARVRDRNAAGRRTSTPRVASSTSARRCRPASCSRRDGKSLVGSSYYTGVSNIFRYDIAPKAGLGADQRRDRLLPAGAAADDGDLFVFRYSGEGFVADAHRRRSRSRTSARSPSSASGWSRSIPC